MGGVKIGRERDAEETAGRPADLAQEIRLFARSVPPRQHADEPPVRQFKTRHIPGIGKGMFRPFPRAVPALFAAGIGPHVMDFDQGLTEMFLRQSLDLPLPQKHRDRERALHMALPRREIDRVRAVDETRRVPTADARTGACRGALGRGGQRLKPVRLPRERHANVRWREAETQDLLLRRPTHRARGVERFPRQMLPRDIFIRGPKPAADEGKEKDEDERFPNSLTAPCR